jgi:ParB family chromosome partitioning protein
MAKTTKKKSAASRRAATVEAPAKAVIEGRSGRKALGRGLSALMAPRAVPVKIQEPALSAPEIQVEEPEAEERAPAPVLKHPALESFKEERTEEPEFVDDIEEEGFDEREPAAKLLNLNISQVEPNPDQPRHEFRSEDIESLAKSIKDTGLLQPIIVRSTSTGRYQIVAGERRWRAAQRAGLVTIPVLVRNLNDQEVLEIGIIENVQRADLNPIEEAMAYQRLSEDFGQTQAQIAEVVGKDRASIANALRLLRLTKDVQRLLAEGQLSAGHGRALLMLESATSQKALANKIIKGGLSVRDAERFASRKNKTGSLKGKSSTGKGANKSYQVMEVEDRLRRALGTKVQLQLDNSGAGEVSIKFFSVAELENLLERLRA